MPLVLHWPAGLSGKRRYDHPISAVDLYPTLTALAGACVPAGKTLDGRDLREALRTGRAAEPDRLLFALRHRKGYHDVGVRQDRWKIARVGRRPWALYDLAADPGEHHDLSREHPVRLRDMVRAASCWAQSHVAPRWFHSLEEARAWQTLGMPRYPETFRITPSR